MLFTHLFKDTKKTIGKKKFYLVFVEKKRKKQEPSLHVVLKSYNANNNIPVKISRFE